MNVNWWKAAGIRAVKTFFQTFAATLGSAAVLESVNWKVVISASAMAAILSLATSLAGLPELELMEEAEGIDDDSE
jgi:hypothetical protein